MATRYKPQEIELLCREYNGYNIPSLAKALRRSESSVNNKLIRLGLHQTKCQDRPYKAQEERYLLKNFDGGNFKELAQTLLRSGYSVRSAVARLYGINPLCVPRMLRDMRQNGMYRGYIERFRSFNPTLYRRALEKGAAHRGNRGTRQ